MMQTMIDENGDEFTAIHLSIGSFAAYTGSPVEKIACMPEANELHAVSGRGFPYLRTGEAKAVTCPLCKGTAAFRAATLHQKLSMGTSQPRMT